MKTKIRKMFGLLLCCIMVLGIFTVTVSAATADETTLPLTYEVDKTDENGAEDNTVKEP